jgi:lipid-A-disaccharide synthase
MGELVRRVLVLFPFEPRFYEEAGVPVTFVGHPVVDGIDEPRDPQRMRDLAGLAPDRPVVALAPGSRESEISRLLRPMLEAAVRIRGRREEVQFLVTLAPGMDPEPVLEQAWALGLKDTRIHQDDFPRILAACEAGIIASGTASLEAAVEGLPIVVVYRMNPLTYLVGRALVKLDNVTLPNLVAGRRVVPELIQGDCESAKIAEEVLGYLEDPGRARKTRDALLALRDSLGGPGAFHRAAEAVLDELGCLSR